MNSPPPFHFAIARVVDAPRDVVWKAWTDANALVQWWSPKGFKTRFAKVDLRPGGLFHYGLESPQGQRFCGRFIYREIVPPEKLVFVLSFADENADVIRNIYNEAWPLEILHTLILTEEGGKTRISVQSVPIDARPEEVAAFEAGAPSMQAGYSGTFENLETYLAKQKA